VGDSNDPQKLDLSGVVVFNQKRNEQNLDFHFYLLGLKNKNIIRTMEEGILTEISPDRKYLAYSYRSYDKDYYHLRVLDSHGETISDFPFSIDGIAQSFFNWQNAEQLRMLQQDQDWRVFVQLLNPFTQEHSVLRTDWDGVYAPENPFYDKLPQWKFDQSVTEIFFVYGSNILYDPTLTRAVYPKDDGNVALVDVKTGTELASAQFIDWGYLPSWSPNGEHLMIVNSEESADEFYLISRDGNKFQKATNFSEEFGSASVSEYAWSPDSKQIAFWLHTETGAQEAGAQSELAILDVATRQVTRLCIHGLSVSASEPWMMGHPEPIWSPDGRYIMITQWDDPAAPRKYSVLVVDPLTGAMEKISENTAPIGWMSSTP